jgi:hypothetical protein
MQHQTVLGPMGTFVRFQAKHGKGPDKSVLSALPNLKNSADFIMADHCMGMESSTSGTVLHG